MICVCVATELIPAYTQNFKENYSPIRNFRPQSEELKRIAAGYDTLTGSAQFKSHKTTKLVVKEIKDLEKHLFSLDSARLIMRSDTLTHYLQRLTDRIAASNPNLVHKNFTVFTYRTCEPNASNRGAGIIFMNLDLITKFENEAQLMFVICHEMSHDILGHVAQTIIRQAELQNDEEFKMKVRAIEKEKYNRYKKIEALYARYLSDATEHSRGHELKADSLGLILFINTGYSPAFAIRETRLLDSVDSPVYTQKLDFLRFFDYPGCRFDKTWLEAENNDGVKTGNLASVKFPDSLKTHPTCKIRTEALERQSKNLHTGNAISVSPEFDYQKQIALFETLQHLQENKELGFALFLDLQMLRLYPDNLYLKNSFLNIVYEIQNAQKEHTFSNSVEFPNPYFCSSYNEVLLLLHNTSSGTLKLMALHYYKDRLEDQKQDAYTGYVYALLKSMDLSKAENEKWPEDYAKAYSNEYYYKKLKEKFPTKPKH